MLLSVFCNPTEKISVILSFITKTGVIKPHLPFFMKAFVFLYNVLHLDCKCCESHLFLSLNRFVQTHLLTTAINNQMNSVLSMLRSIVYKVHSLSADFNIKFVQRSVNGI